MFERKNEIGIKCMKDFVEGRISTEDFWEIYKQNGTIRELLIKDKTRPMGVWDLNEKTGEVEFHKNIPSDSQYFFAPENLLEVVNISKLEAKAEIFRIVRMYFVRRNEKLNFYNNDSNKYYYLMKMLPSWLDIRDEEFLLNIYNSTPDNLSKVDKLKFCKEKIKELFKYDKTPPRWVQYAAWPIVNGKPLVFRKQSKEILDDERVYFYFYDSDTGEEIVIEQLY